VRFLFDFDGLILDTETASKPAGRGSTSNTGTNCRRRSGP
jgi:hypothetical protein